MDNHVLGANFDHLLMLMTQCHTTHTVKMLTSVAWIEEKGRGLFMNDYIRGGGGGGGGCPSPPPPPHPGVLGGSAVSSPRPNSLKKIVLCSKTLHKAACINNTREKVSNHFEIIA